MDNGQTLQANDGIQTNVNNQADPNAQTTVADPSTATATANTSRVSGSTYYKQKLAEIEASRLAVQEELENLKTSQLKEKESFKELYELEKTKREQAELKTQDLSKTVFKTFKSNAIEKEAVALGLIPSAIDDLSLLDTSMVEVETTDKGTINIIGAKEFAESLKTKKNHWFVDNTAPLINVNNPSGNITGPEMSASELVELQKTDAKKYNEIMSKKLAVVK